MRDELIELALDVLRRGGVIAYPTDTVYGIGADARNRSAVERIYRIKQRPAEQPLPLLIAGVEDMLTLTQSLSRVARILAESFWPGGLTLVMQKSPAVPDWITSGSDTVAVRVPGHPVPLALIKALGSPLVGTSANRSGLPSPIRAEDVKEQVGSEVDFILDAGECPKGIESTIVDVTSEIPRILREGAISREAITGVCGCGM